MDNRLKNFKKALDETAFKHVAFTKEHTHYIQQEIHNTLCQQTILAMLTTRKSGVELAHQLHVRDSNDIDGKEGQLYALLHEAELQGLLSAQWQDDVKYYKLTKRGQKQLQQEKVKIPLKQRLFGGQMYEQ